MSGSWSGGLVISHGNGPKVYGRSCFESPNDFKFLTGTFAPPPLGLLSHFVISNKLSKLRAKIANNDNTRAAADYRDAVGKSAPGWHVGEDQAKLETIN